MMTSFEELVERQQRTGQGILQIIRNFKKDGPERKRTVKYFHDRVQQLDELWSQFEDTDNEIRLTNDLDKTHDYFVKDYWSEIMSVMQTYRDTFNREIEKLTPTPLPRDEEAGGMMGKAEPHRTSDAGQFVSRIGLVRKLEMKMGAMLRLLSNTASLEDQPQSVYELQKTSIHQLWSQIEDINGTIWETIENPESQGFDGERYIELESQVLTMIMELTKKISIIDDMGTKKDKAIQLPKVVIPKFDGTYAKWPQFHDLFTQMVDKQSLPEVQKMWYLKTNLTGEAEQIIRHFNISDNNYVSAWETLKNRYNNKRLLTSTLIQQIMDQPNQSSVSAVALKSLHDTTQECLMALGNLGIDTTTWDPILLYILVKKLDTRTRMSYEQTIPNPTELQSVKSFLAFIQVHFQSLETIGRNGREVATRSCGLTAAQAVKDRCVLCQNGAHQLFQCNQFLQQSPNERAKSVLKLRLCYNCLKPGHMASKCMARSCTRCEKKHNSLLHIMEREASTNASMVKAVTATATQNMFNQGYVILGTAIVRLVANNGQQIECRALLDSGSQVNLVSRRVVKQLRINPQSSHAKIMGIDNGMREARQRINVSLQSRVTDFETRLEAFVLPNIISNQPSQFIDISSWKIPAKMTLADPTFNRPGSVDLLIGAEFFHQILSPGVNNWSDNLPLLQNSLFGWIVVGKIKEGQSENTSSTVGICTQNDSNLENMVERLWKLEEIDNKRTPLSPIDLACENHFTSHIQRTSEGRYMVRLPFYEDTTKLGSSSEMAMSRFLALERKLNRDPELKQQYAAFMAEYESLGHMEQVQIENVTTHCFPTFKSYIYCSLLDIKTAEIHVCFLS